MIVRIFRATVPSDRQDEFEKKFLSVSIPFVRKHSGLVSVSIGRPTEWAPEEYVMVSKWESLDALQAMTGERVDEAVIPSGMEELVSECWVHHYELFDN